MKYIADWQKKSLKCYFCGNDQSVKYQVVIMENDKAKEVCSCNKCIFLHEIKGERCHNMPMTYEEMKREILFYYHKNIDFWWQLVGEMFEKSNGFTKAAEITCGIFGMKYCISWDNYEWRIESV